MPLVDVTQVSSSPAAQGGGNQPILRYPEAERDPMSAAGAGVVRNAAGVADKTEVRGRSTPRGQFPPVCCGTAVACSFYDVFFRASEKRILLKVARTVSDL